MPIRTLGTGPYSSGTAAAPEAIDFGTRLGGSSRPPGLMTGLGSESGSPISIDAIPLSGARFDLGDLARGELHGEQIAPANRIPREHVAAAVRFCQSNETAQLDLVRQRLIGGGRGQRLFG